MSLGVSMSLLNHIIYIKLQYFMGNFIIMGNYLGRTISKKKLRKYVQKSGNSPDQAKFVVACTSLISHKFLSDQINP